MELSTEGILSVTDNGLAVFEYFLRNSSYNGLGKSFYSPFYTDSKPSCSIYFNEKAHQYFFKDFGDANFHLNCFAFVAQLHSLSTKGKDFVTVLELINDKLNLHFKADRKNRISPLSKIKRTVEAKPKPENQELNISSQFIPPSYRNFTLEERDYWMQFGIHLGILKRFNVRALDQVQGVSQSGNSFKINSSTKEPLFAYPGKDFVKFYRPFSTKFRFLYQGNKSGTYCFGLKQLPKKGDLLFITGGEKDVMSLAAKDFHAICFNSETASIPKSIIKRLKFRFKHIVLLYDNDKTGLKAMTAQQSSLKEFLVKSLILPKFPDSIGKDISDYFAQGHSREELLELFVDLLKVEYEETMSMMASCEVQFDHAPTTPDPILRINETVVGSAGNLLALTGPEGSGKSNFLGAVLAGTIGNKTKEIDTLGTDILVNSKEKAVLVYDTEQSEDQLYRNMHQVLRRARQNAPPKWLKVYGLVSIDRKDRLTSILQSMDQLYYTNGGIQLVIIDGIADLIDSVNDEEKAVALIDELFRLAGIYNTCILCVLHLSPSGYKLRGHLGSEIQRKAAGIIAVEKEENKDISIIKALKVRDGSPLEVPQIQMIWNHELKYHVNGGENVPLSSQTRKKQELNDIAKSIFKEKPGYTYGELVQELSNRLGIKERQGKNYVKLMRDFGFIELNQKSPRQYESKIEPK